jgi:KEOPS complex subunit Cgi121
MIDKKDRKVLKIHIRSIMMNEIRLLFGKPVIGDRAELISALKDLQSVHGCVVLALDAGKVVSERHISFATEKALAATLEKRNIAKDVGMEIMRYASGERQIERAMAMGLSSSTGRIALILVSFGCDCSWPNDSEVRKIIDPDGRGCSFESEAVKKTFNISPKEIEVVGERRIEDLVIERVALVDTYR